MKTILINGKEVEKVSDTFFEVCNYCESEVELITKFEVQECPKCHKLIKPCALCDSDTTNCTKCVFALKTISFYVAECMEFTSLGECHENIQTVKEAIKIYESIPDERLNGGKGIGFILQDKTDKSYDGCSFELLLNDEIDVDTINSIKYFKDSHLVQNAIAELTKYFL